MNDQQKSSAALALRSQDPSSFGSSRDPMRIASHVVGVISLIWSLVAWSEWFLIPLLYPDDGSPAPHLAFAPQAILLFLGCIGILILIPLLAIALRRSRMLIYAVPAVAFVAFQVWRFVSDILW